MEELDVRGRDGDGSLERTATRRSGDRSKVAADTPAEQDARDRQDASDRFEVRVERQREDARDAEDRFEVMVNHQRVEAHDAAARFETLVRADRARAGDAQDRFQTRIDAERTRSQPHLDRRSGGGAPGRRLEVLGQLTDGVVEEISDLLSVVVDRAVFVADELAAARPDPAAAARDVRRIQQAAERAAALAHELLAFARRAVAPAPVLDLNALVADMEHLLRCTVGPAVTLHTDLGEDLRPVVADPGRLEQVLVDLAVNARDATAGGGAFVIDTANADPGGPAEAGGGHVRMRVTDPAAGLPAEVVERIRSSFDGADPGTNGDRPAGSGASVEVHSQPGAGTMVTITIPAAPERAGPTGAASGSPRPPAAEWPGRG